MSFTFSLYLRCCFQSNLKPSSKPSKASPIVSKFWRLEFHLRLSIIWMAPPFADFTSPLTYMLGIPQNTAHCFSEMSDSAFVQNLLLHLEGGSQLNLPGETDWVLKIQGQIHLLFCHPSCLQRALHEPGFCLFRQWQLYGHLSF